MKRSPLKPISLKHLAQMNAEADIRIALCKRCGGHPAESFIPIPYLPNNATLRVIICFGGKCEICRKPARRHEVLEPHEKIFRSQGGKLSLANSVMAHRLCHMAKHGAKIPPRTPLLK